MAEFLTFAAQVMLTKVASLAAQEFDLGWEFNGEIRKLRESLLVLESMLRDAEHLPQDPGEAAKRWLEELEDIAHLADDLFDDYGYELLRRNQMKLHSIISLSSSIFFFRYEMANKIKKINTSLEGLYKKGSAVGLVPRLTFDATSSYYRRIDRQTCSYFEKDESSIIGRKDVVEDIVKALTNSNKSQENDLSVLAIVGMGGLGKTTLAKSVYHDDKIEQHFQEKIWLCVSIPFEVNLILKGILESLKCKDATVQTIGAICRILREELKEKRYLLVLDDVWNEDAQKWKKLISCLGDVTDTQGSSILVTTRSNQVAKMVETLPRCDLKNLSDDECWLILKDKAISVGGASIPGDQEKIGREIAKKCGGVPLAAEVLGNMMRSRNYDGWQSIVESSIRDLPDEENRIMAILKLSFDELKSPSLKQCFAYCSMFVKDFEFEKDDLIQLWMAQGWLHPSPDKNNLEMEDRGNEYFTILLQNSLFQDVERHGDIITCKMHNLVHDLAQHVSKSKYLHSLFSNGAVLDNNSPGFKALRVLNLYKADIQELPASIGNLRHLRYLNVMYTKIKAFPKSLGKLYNLQTFKMPSHLRKFPKKIANLINLRHIYFGEDMKVPAGVLRRLTNLRSLPFVKMDKETGPQIEELGGLNHLKDALSIYNLEHVRDKEEAEKANLVEKKHVRKLALTWEYRPSSSANSDEGVLEVLRPHSNLEFLKIHEFMGVKFPSWLSLSNNLKEIELSACRKCEGAPVLGHLPNLVLVKMELMQTLGCLGYEFYGYDHASDDTKVLFPALKTLHIVRASNLIEWKEVATERVKVFPFLEELTLGGCSQLSSAPSHFPSLKKLAIEDMNSGGIPIASILSNKLTTLTSLVICSVRGLACLPERLLENNQNLAYLEIRDCEELTCIAPPQSQGFECCCASLQELRISGCPKLRCLPDYGLLHPLSLEKLEIRNCDSLESIPIIPEHGGLPSLHQLWIEECPQLSSLPDGLQYCTSLQQLEIQSCPKITSIPIPSEGLPYLRWLELRRCPELSSLPSGLGCCTSLVHLEVTQCPKVTSIPIGSLSTTLRDLYVDNPGSPERLEVVDECSTIMKGDNVDLEDKTTLTPLLKQLFLYCSLFPLDYEFKKYELVQLWIAQGFIGETQKETMEDTGISYFTSLENEDYFVPSRRDFSVNFDSLFSMPVYNTSNFLYRVNATKLSVLDKRIDGGNYFQAVNVGQLCGASESLTKHLSLKISESNDEMTYGVVQKFKNLQTLLLFSSSVSSIKHVPRDLFLSLHELRTLNLSRALISGLPSSIGEARQLRYLDVSYTPITQLPESISSLHQLQTLKLRGCVHFSMLPRATKNLTNLRHIELDIILQLDAMPTYLGNLTNLQTLSAFLVGTDDGCRINELKNLNDLKGALGISGLENVASKEEAEEAALLNKKYLQRLNLRWSNVMADEKSDEEKLTVQNKEKTMYTEEELILESLRPPNGLKELQIEHYAGSVLPSWISDPIFADLVVITLYRCKHCTLVPSLGLLPGLKSLSIIEMNAVEEINREFFRNDGVNDHSPQAFPKLEMLEVDIMLNLKDWKGIQIGDLPILHKLTVNSCPELVTIPSVSILKSLKHLEFRRCPKLPSLPNDGLPTSLESFIIKDCPQLEKSCVNVKGEDWSKIRCVPNVWFDDEEIISQGSSEKDSDDAVTPSREDDVQSAADEELMQCLEILNNMEEIDDDSYSKALKFFHGEISWRRVFVHMAEKRRKGFILNL